MHRSKNFLKMEIHKTFYAWEVHVVEMYKVLFPSLILYEKLLLNYQNICFTKNIY